MKHGYAFGDYISTGKTSKYSVKKYDTPDKSKPSMRGYVVPIILVLLIVILVGRLFWLQVVHGADYRILSDSNRMRTQIIYAPRGVIFDRNNTPLVFNIPGFRKIEDGKTTLLTRNQALSLLAKGEKNLEVDQLREYPYKESTAHVLGYIGQISEDELKEDTFKDYLPGDLIGKIGIERRYEATLIGQNGKKLIEVDSAGKPVRTLGQTDPIPGNNITLTIDAKLQEASYNALPQDKKGVVISSTPDGQILSLVSRPSFDPNLFTLGEHYVPATNSAYESIGDILLDSTNQPMLNRAIGGSYPPASTFKLITAAAGLEKNIIDETYEVEDTGILRVGDFSFANWYFTQYGGKDKDVNVVKAISRSNDIFFYKLAEKVGVSEISNMAKQFGLGSKLGIDLNGELEGVVPDPEWKKKVIKEQWYLGDTYHYGIGQGYLLTTPLQVNAWTQSIANGGTLYRPHLIKNVDKIVLHENVISEKTNQLIVQGMIDSCKNETGVAWPLYDFTVKNKNLKIDGKNILEAVVATQGAGIKPEEVKDYRRIAIACKTGTAEHNLEKKTHAWITLFAPAYNPEIVVTVLIEEGGEGSSDAGPVAKKVLEDWFSR